MFGWRSRKIWGTVSNVGQWVGFKVLRGVVDPRTLEVLRLKSPTVPTPPNSPLGPIYLPLHLDPDERGFDAGISLLIWSNVSKPYRCKSYQANMVLSSVA